MTTFWLKDITILYKHYEAFTPTQEMTTIERLNALTRFCMYLFVIFVMLNRDQELLFLPLIGIFLIVLFYLFCVQDEEHMSGSPTYAEIEPIVSVNEYESDSGLYDTDLKFLGIDTTTQRDKYVSKSQLTCEQNIKENNPFKNPNTENMNSSQTIACNADKADLIQNDMVVFTPDMYMDIEEVFNKKNSQRQFFTVAQSVPNDQEGFARWCYNLQPTCKTDQSECTNYPSVRTASMSTSPSM